ncbi:carboxypeptidase regulatory-like domain-containing protein [bacterium]|nr:carboxypeptidase regulatory-like domain-containing protein [bacterium]
MRVIKILTTIITILGVCSIVYGQETTETPTEVAFPHGGISGVVTDAKSNALIRDAKVEVTKNGFSFGVSAKTDADGKYTIENVPVGIFDLSISKKKYLPKVVSDITVKNGEVTANVNIAIALITPIQVGDEARDFTLSTVKGKLVTLSDFVGKKIVVFSVNNPYG